MEQYEKVALQDLAAYGLTSVHDATAKAQQVRAFQSMRDKGQLTIRVYPLLDVRDPENDAYLRRGPIIDPQHMLDIRSVKISTDGALGSRGAALFEDYSDEHAQIIRVQDIPRFAELGVIASVQPTHATSDKNMAGDRLGNDRLAGAYAWRKLLNAKAVVAGGSDFPVESPNPFFGLHAAVTRQSQDNQPSGGWLPQEKLARDEALSIFTEGAAYAAHQEKVIGRLLPGYYADFILVRDNYFEVPEQDIWNNQVLATYVAGRRVYAR